MPVSRLRSGRPRNLATLNTLALSNASFLTSDPQNTLIGAVSGLTASSSLAVNPADARVGLSGSNLLVGSSLSSAGTFGITLTETLGGAIGSPKSTSFTITVFDPTSGRGNDGTGSKPAGAVDATTANWYSKLTALSPGGSIYLAPGDYGYFDLYGLNFAAPGVTIYGQTGVHATYINVANCSGITFKYLNTTGTNGPGWGTSINSYCNRVYFDHLTITGSVSPLNGVGGYTASVAVHLRDSTNVGVTNCIVNYFNSGMDGLDCSNVTIQGNLVDHYSNNGMFYLGFATALIDRNVITRLDAFQNDGNHPDGIQLADSSGVRCTDITISNNYVNNGISDPTAYAASVVFDGIYLEHSDRITITGNAVVDVGGNGILTSDCTQVTDNDNYTNGYQKGQSNNYTRGGCDHVAFNRNVGVLIPYTYYDPAATNPTESPPTNVTFGSGADANTTVAQMTAANDTAGLLAWHATHTACPLS